MKANTDTDKDTDTKRSSRSVNLVIWSLGTLLAAGASWLLWKVYGRQLLAAPGEILLTMSRPEAVEPPYPLEDIGGQWGLLLLGDLPSKYGRMTALLAAWWLGVAMLLGLVLSRLRGTGINGMGRIFMTLAGLAVFGAGLLLLQAGFRAGANFERMAGVGSLDPFMAARLMPLSLATKASLLLSLASFMLAAAAGVGFNQAGKAVFAPARYRVLPFRLAVAVSLVALALLVIYALVTGSGAIPHLLAHRLTDLEQTETVDRINGILNGIKLSGVAVQFAGLLWVVAAWVAPGGATSRKR